jgi:hypothetical protein
VHEIGQDAHRLLDRRQRIPDVELVQVDAIGLQATEAVLDLAAQVTPRAPHVVRPRTEREVALRREHDVRPAVLQRAAKDLLAPPARVHVRGVDEVSAGLEESVDHGAAGGLVAAPPLLVAEVHRAQAQA